LEGLVFGARAGEAMKDSTKHVGEACAASIEAPQIAERELREITWRGAGLVRSATGLSRMVEELEALPALPAVSRSDFERRSIYETALLIARSALWREESRGGHFRSDFPEKRPEFQTHSSVRRGAAVTRLAF